MPTLREDDGAGAMLAHDFRVVRSNRGYFCFLEVDINNRATAATALRNPEPAVQT